MKKITRTGNFGTLRGYLLGTLMGLSCLVALTPAARADMIFNSSQGFCCFSVNLHQAGVDDIFVTVSLTDGATVFANTGNTNHPGFAFNLAGTAITAANIVDPVNLSTFHVGPVVTSGPDFGTFGYYFDIPGNGISANDTGPLTFTIHRSNILFSDFTANAAGYYFAADVCNPSVDAAACTGESGINTAPNPTIPEPVTSSLVGGGLLALGLLRKRLPR